MLSLEDKLSVQNTKALAFPQKKSPSQAYITDPAPLIHKSWIQGMRSAWALWKLGIRCHVTFLIFPAQTAGLWFKPMLSTHPTLWWWRWWCTVINTEASHGPPLFLPHFPLWMGWGGIAEWLLYLLMQRAQGTTEKGNVSIALISTLPQQGVSGGRQWDSHSVEVLGGVGNGQLAKGIKVYLGAGWVLILYKPSPSQREATADNGS